MDAICPLCKGNCVVHVQHSYTDDSMMHLCLDCGRVGSDGEFIRDVFRELIKSALTQNDPDIATMRSAMMKGLELC